MKKILTFVLLNSITYNTIACDWSTIKKTNEGYLYSIECHQKVGALVNNEEIYQKQTKELNKALELKDLALQKADERISNWREESYKQHEYLMKESRMSDFQKWMYFGLGVVVTGLAVHGASKLTK